MSSSSSSSNSPCAACKFLRRKCTPGCVFAPYFPPDQPQKFANVHRVFGASNASKLLSELPPERRGDAANSLAYEAKARVDDPIYGCVGYISLLQHRLRQVHDDLSAARKELASYLGPSAAVYPNHFPHLQHYPAAAAQPVVFAVPTAGMGIGLGLGIPGTASVNPVMQQQVTSEMQQLALMAAAREQQEMMNAAGLEQQHQQLQQQLELGRLGHGGFLQITGAGNGTASVLKSGQENTFHVSQQQQQKQFQHHRSGNGDVREGVGP